MIYGHCYRTPGRILGYTVGETRDHVATVLFRRYPKALTVSTSDAFRPVGGNFERVVFVDGVGYANATTDVRWIDRRNFKPGADV